MASRADELRRLRRQVKALKEKNSLLQLYPADRGILTLIRRTAKALDRSARTSAGPILAEFFDQLPDPPRNSPASVILSGPVRSGKSTVAKLVCLQSSALYVQFDLLGRLWVGEDKVQDEEILALLLENLRRKYARGAVIESTSLIFNGTRTAVEMIRQFAADDIRTVLVGSADASVEEKIAALLAHHRIKRSWTEELDDDGLRARAEQIVALSVTARRVAAEAGVPYFELGMDSFGRDVRHAVSTIIDTCGFG
jgi:predicted kinase